MYKYEKISLKFTVRWLYYEKYDIKSVYIKAM